MAYVIEPLGPQHDRGAFCCGNQVIDKFCRERAQSDHDRYKVRVHVACEEESQHVVGFYSLVTSTLEAKRILGLAKFGKRPIPAIYLAMLGVSEDHAGKGLGKALMADAFERSVMIAHNAGAYCLWLQAVDERTAGYYQKLDFQRIEQGELDMFIAIDTMKDALGVV